MKSKIAPPLSFQTFWISARAYLDAAEAAHERMHTPGYAGNIVMVVVFLYLRVIELALKSYNKQHGCSDSYLKDKLSHSLSLSLQTACERNLSKVVPVSLQTEEMIDRYSPYYSGKWFEYIDDFSIHDTSVEPLRQFALDLVEGLRSDYLRNR